MAASIDQVSAPAPTVASSIPGSLQDDLIKQSVPDGAGPAVGAPKPVEVTSVPETPVDNRTPAGGTPRPELDLQEAKGTPTPQEAPVILGPRDPKSPPKEPAPEPITEANAPNGSGPPVEMTGALRITPSGGKRKAEEEEKQAAPPNGAEEKAAGEDDQRPEKKAKITDKIADAVSDVKDKIESKTTGATNGNGNANGKGKPGRPKKDKKAAPTVGRTQRKTRSQGPVDQPLSPNSEKAKWGI